MLLKSQRIDNIATCTHDPSRMGFMSKTAAFMGMGSLRNLVSDSVAIDMGSGATIIYVLGRGVVVDEPSLVAVNNVSGEVLSVGLEARQMYGREARDVSVVAPEPISMATESETRFRSDPMPMNAAVLLMNPMREGSCVQVAMLSILCDFSSIASHGYQT